MGEKRENFDREIEALKKIQIEILQQQKKLKLIHWMGFTGNWST